jgi:hypothetical protein
VITFLSELRAIYSTNIGSVNFMMRRRNKTVTLQWEPFTGVLTASGIAYLTVTTPIANTPPYPIESSIEIEYNGTRRKTFIQIDPFATSSNIRFYLNTDGSASNVLIGDTVVVKGGNAKWIVN